MNKLTAWLSTVLAIGVGGFFAAIGSTHGARVAGIPIYAIVIAGTFALQWIAFVPSWLYRSEKFFDFMGACGFIVVVWGAMLASDAINVQSCVIAVCITVWAIRLGVFLTRRVLKAGSDQRFDEIKQDSSLFFMAWTLQALWISVTASAALVALTSRDTASNIDTWLLAGATLWIAGFGIETTADFQKSRFRKLPENQQNFMSDGLWAWSQHPNYFGEILLWIGIAVIAVPTMQGWQFIALGSPVFVWLLITKVSGMRMLDERAAKRWGDNPEYEQYVNRTSKLILWPPSTNEGAGRN